MKWNIREVLLSDTAPREGPLMWMNGSGHILASPSPPSLVALATWTERLPASCRGFPACSKFQFPLSSQFQGRKCGGVGGGGGWGGEWGGGGGSWISKAGPPGMVCHTSPCFVKWRREPGYAFHSFSCFLFMTHFWRVFPLPELSAGRARGGLGVPLTVGCTQRQLSQVKISLWATHPSVSGPHV